MTRPIQASLDLQALKQNLSIVRQAAPHAGGKSERLRAWY
ncbi:alanine racemase [Shigella dysenteriae]|uniref:Alanine racemase n=5 Tax=Shigella TaxID=620 RepID=A0A2S8DCF6_SHIDY|nr:alanine racemase [Shigella boydii]EFP5951412.1 alanine racemase [Shigella dysenteriae]EFV8764103.1 alanine racemase [Shigella flexneri]EFW48994.1 Alanine racemase, catabolic [Shigella dysenteriae CDC 74-1112]EFY9107972.1 alanine racemase [Shigella sonnei]EGI99473.1 alanine racemase, catabolic domain protein [Shigella boydii 3594-74]EIQ14147.1 alanine racemase, catabolic domain protein [Shigella flexneri CCH060]EIQ24133.1 alanine racemase, catabolic domain protein [Shigella flexneri K-315]